jgi:hypothetical protein
LYLIVFDGKNEKGCILGDIWNHLSACINIVFVITSVKFFGQFPSRTCGWTTRYNEHSPWCKIEAFILFVVDCINGMDDWQLCMHLAVLSIGAAAFTSVDPFLDFISNDGCVRTHGIVFVKNGGPSTVGSHRSSSCAFDRFLMVAAWIAIFRVGL